MCLGSGQRRGAVGRVDAGRFCRFQPGPEVEDDLQTFVKKGERPGQFCSFFIFIRETDTSWLSWFGPLGLVSLFFFLILL
jgi:hypothetical protein